MVLRTGAGVVKKQQEGSDVYEYGGSDWTAPGTLPGEREMGFLHFCSLKKRASKPTHAYIVTRNARVCGAMPSRRVHATCLPQALLRARGVWDACAALKRRDLAIGARAGAQRTGAPRRGAGVPRDADPDGVRPRCPRLGQGTASGATPPPRGDPGGEPECAGANQHYFTRPSRLHV